MVSSYLVLAAGPYWGTQKFIVEDFQQKYPNSIKATRLGWMSPNPKKHLEYGPVDPVHGGPTKDEYTKGVKVELNDPKAHFKPLIEFFFLFHDSTLELKSKGKIEHGSFIFCADEEQCNIACEVRSDLQAKVAANQVTCFANAKINTKIGPATMFFPAPEEHQNYLEIYPMNKLVQKMYLKEYPEWKNGVVVPVTSMPKKSKSRVWEKIDKKFTITADDLAAKENDSPKKPFKETELWKSIDKKFTITADDLAAKESGSSPKERKESQLWKSIDERFTITAESLAAKQ